MWGFFHVNTIKFIRGYSYLVDNDNFQQIEHADWIELPLSIPKDNPARIVLSPINFPTFFNVILASICLINELHTKNYLSHSLQ